jgi:hypothetical protein
MQTYIRTYIHTYIHAKVYINIRTYIHAYTHIYNIHTYTYSYIHTHTYIYSIRTYTYTYIYTYIHSFIKKHTRTRLNRCRPTVIRGLRNENLSTKCVIFLWIMVYQRDKFAESGHSLPFFLSAVSSMSGRNEESHPLARYVALVRESHAARTSSRYYACSLPSAN